MARRRKDIEEQEEEQPAPARAETIALISAGALRSLIKAHDGYKGQIEGLTGELRETIGNAVEKKKLDKDAYALLIKLRRVRLKKGPERARQLWDTLLAYLDMSGEMKLLEDVQSLDLGDGDEENVARPQFGRQTAEAAE